MAILGIDIGTTSCKCVVFDESFRVISRAHRKYPLIHTEDWIEQDPAEWWGAVLAAVREISGGNYIITGIGISSQGITFVPVDEDGNALANAITWLDMRASAECGRIEKRFGSEKIFRVTGKRINPAYTLPKLMWLKANQNEVYKRTYKFLTAHDYIINRLCGAFVTEDSLAAGTMAYDISKKSWDSEILTAAGIDADKLPQIKPSGSIAGKIDGNVADELGLSAETIVFTGGQDQKCAAFGAGISNDTVTVSLGTSCAITALYDKPSFTDDMSLPCFPFVDGKSWVLEGFGSTAGAAFGWFKKNIAGGKTSSEIDLEIEEGYDNPGSVMFFPYLGGTGSPEWYDADGGGFHGLTLGTTESDMARALFESIAFTIRANIEKMESLGRKYRTISVFGGGAYSDIWLRIISDVTGRKVVVPGIRQTACLGAAMKCSEGGYDFAIEKTLEADERKHSHYDALYMKYKIIEKKIYG